MGFGLSDDDIDVARQMLDEKLLPIDLLLYVKQSFLEQAKAGRSAVVAQYADPASRAPRVDGDGRYLNRVRLAGVKFWLDGSMDNAFMSQPYTNNPPGNSEKTSAAWPWIPRRPWRPRWPPLGRATARWPATASATRRWTIFWLRSRRPMPPRARPITGR
jgi:hypothetical protein